MSPFQVYARITLLLTFGVIALFWVTGCGDRRQRPTDPNAFSAKAFFAELDRRSGGSEGGQ